jgi:4-amino-4-deoxy-L-arabinose transferase-like glycosyltransferase
MKRNYPLFIILAVALVIRLIFAFSWHEILWDSGVYIGMGKYLFSAGNSGLWEHIRPPFIPIMLGIFWKLGLNPALFGRLFEILLMLGIVWLTYQLARDWWDEKTAIIASLIVALSPIFYYLSFHQYTEIPHTFFALLALWLFTKERYYWSGFAVGVAYVSKFTAGIFIVVLIAALVCSKKGKKIVPALAGFMTIIIPYALYSWLAYGSPFATAAAAQDTISKVLGCNVLHNKPWWYYGWWISITETNLHFLAIPGLYALWKRWEKQHMLYALSLLLPALYLIQLHCHDYRYLTLTLPFIAMLTALGFVWISDLFKIKKNWAFFLVATVLGIWMLNSSITYYYGNELQQQDEIAERYFAYINGKNFSGEIWTANPIIAAHTNAKLEKIYYPVYGTNVSEYFTDYVKAYHDKISVIMMDNCGGGIICPPDDSECPQKTDELITEIDSKFTRMFDKSSGRCWYRIWITS